jgi:hypothetical protein
MSLLLLGLIDFAPNVSLPVIDYVVLDGVLFYPFGKGIGAIDPPDIEVFT